MAYNNAYRVGGQTVNIAVTNTSGTPVLLKAYTNDEVRYAMVLNSTNQEIAVRFSQDGSAATLPVSGTPGDLVIPGPDVVFVIAIPPPPCYVTAIAGAPGPSGIYITPVDGS